LEGPLSLETGPSTRPLDDGSSEGLLKTAPSRPGALRRMQLLLLQENVSAIRTRYNARFLALRDVKRLVVAAVGEATAAKFLLQQKIADLEDTARPPPSKAPFQIDAAEWPDVSRSRTPAEFAAAVAAPAQDAAKPPGAAQRAALLRASPALRIFEASKPEAAERQRGDSADQLVHAAAFLRHEVGNVEARIATHLQAFDKAVYALRREHVPLVCDLKAAELRLLLLFQELSRLESFEARDAALQQKLQKTKADEVEVATAMADCEAKLATKRFEAQTWAERSKALEAEVAGVVPAHHAFHEPLLKVFNRKAARKRSGGEDDDEDFDDDFDDDEDEEDFDDSCPPGCDAALYEHVKELREKRFDQDEVIAELTKQLDDFKRTSDRYCQRKKQLDKDLLSLERGVRAFQTEKQQQLNLLGTTCALHLDQIHVFNDAAPDAGPAVLPWKSETDSASDQAYSSAQLAPKAGLDGAVLFSRRRLDLLRQRISGLAAENKIARLSFKDLHRAKVRLARSAASRANQLAALAARSADLQLLKFGRLIELDKMDRDSAVSVREAAAHSDVDALERGHRVAAQQLEARAAQLKQRLVELTLINTEALQAIAGLSQRQFAVEGNSTSGKNKPTVRDAAPTLRREMEERNRLVALVKLQAKEIDALKAEINLLRRKGGHVYVPVRAAQSLDNAQVPTIENVTPARAY